MGKFCVGWGQADITPQGGKVVIAGEVPWRTTQVVHDPIFAVAMIIESEGGRSILVSCDFCHPTIRVRRQVCEILKDKLPGFADEQLVLNGTHATACFYMTDDEFLHLAGNRADCADFEDILPLEQLREQVCTKIAEAVLAAADNMEEAEAASASTEILTGVCRRVLYENGTAEMYGDVHRADFCRMEYPDGGPTQMLYFYRASDHRLQGIFANVPCPSQADESSAYLTADYWGVVRDCLRETYGRDIYVLATCRAAGELSPHRMILSPDPDRDLEWGRQRTVRLGEWIAEHIIREEQKLGREEVKQELRHRQITRKFAFPVRLPGEQEYRKALAYMDNPEAFDETGCAYSWMDFSEASHVIRMWKERPEVYRTDVSVLQLGDNLIFTAPVELYSEYAKRIAMAFREYRMFDIQLAQDYMGYLPTREAVAHGGYSTYYFSTVSGPEGGEYYVRETIALLKELVEQV